MYLAPSSSGPGRRPLKAVAPVQIRSGLLINAVLLLNRRAGQCRYSRRVRRQSRPPFFENVGRLLLNGGVATATRPAVTEADLRAAAGERSFERGTRYLHAVSSIEVLGNQVIATVQGSAEYLVVLTLPDRSSGARLRGECGCPYGQEGFFCKHCVAVGLALLRDARSGAAPAAVTHAISGQRPQLLAELAEPGRPRRARLRPGR